jgi:prevent-host-death family protein
MTIVTYLKMETISVSRFKATCLALLERVRRTGEPILVTKRGVPIAQVVPPPQARRSGRSAYGAMKGRAKELADIVAPLFPQGIEVKDWDELR